MAVGGALAAGPVRCRASSSSSANSVSVCKPWMSSVEAALLDVVGGAGAAAAAAAAGAGASAGATWATGAAAGATFARSTDSCSGDALPNK